MISRRCILGVALILATVAPVATSMGDGKCESGNAAGEWSVPRKDHRGWAAGTLFADASDIPVYSMKALLFGGTNFTDAKHDRASYSFGYLTPHANDKNQARYFLFGKWGASAKGTGHFRMIVIPLHDLSSMFNGGVGWIEGHFSAPPDIKVGSFKGKWEICD